MFINEGAFWVGTEPQILDEAAWPLTGSAVLINMINLLLVFYPGDCGCTNGDDLGDFSTWVDAGETNGSHALPVSGQNVVMLCCHQIQQPGLG